MSRTSDKSERFSALISEHNGLIYKVCYLYAEDSEHLKDLYQEVTLNIWQGIDSYQGKSQLSTWIYRVAINTCVSYMRRNSRHSNADPLDDRALMVADEDAERAEQLRQMYELISQLGRLDKAIILLWLDEYSYDEISSLTGITRNNVASRIHRIKLRLAADNN